jgi:hypothetical protein
MKSNKLKSLNPHYSAKTCGELSQEELKRIVESDGTIRGAGQTADLSIDINFVEHGYQCDIYARGKHVGTECRDFGGTHKIEDLAQLFYDEFHTKFLADFRKKADKLPEVK